MKIITKEKVFSHFGPDTAFADYVEDGETFTVEADDCYLGQIASPSVRRGDIDRDRIDWSVGPIEVRGSLPGDVLELRIGKITLADHGIMAMAPGFGILGDKITAEDTKFIPIRGAEALFREDIRIPLAPMVGVIGVASETPVHCAVPGDHGANLDTKLLKEGTVLYLPVVRAGAGLGVGDIHAAMGDGELSGSGIEIAGSVQLTASVRRDIRLLRPVAECDGAYYFLASRPTVDESVRLAADDAVNFLMQCFDLDYPDAYRLLSAACDIQISELVDENVTVRVRVPVFDERIDIRKTGIPSHSGNDC